MGSLMVAHMCWGCGRSGPPTHVRSHPRPPELVCLSRACLFTKDSEILKGLKITGLELVSSISALTFHKGVRRLEWALLGQEAGAGSRSGPDGVSEQHKAGSSQAIRGLAAFPPGKLTLSCGSGNRKEAGWVGVPHLGFQVLCLLFYQVLTVYLSSEPTQSKSQGKVVRSQSKAKESGDTSPSYSILSQSDSPWAGLRKVSFLL